MKDIRFFFSKIPKRGASKGDKIVIMSVGFCAVTACFVFVLVLVSLAECVQRREVARCLNGWVYFAAALTLLNVVIWCCATRCCCSCFCHGCCFKWRKFKGRRVLARLRKHLMLRELAPGGPDDALVRQVESLMRETWLYNDHVGADARSLAQVHHRSLRLTHVFAIHNEDRLQRYFLRHLNIYSRYNIPQELHDRPIKTKTVNGRVMSEASLFLLDRCASSQLSARNSISEEGTSCPATNLSSSCTVAATIHDTSVDVAQLKKHLSDLDLNEKTKRLPQPNAVIPQDILKNRKRGRSLSLTCITQLRSSSLLGNLTKQNSVLDPPVKFLVSSDDEGDYVNSSPDRFSMSDPITIPNNIEPLEEKENCVRPRKHNRKRNDRRRNGVVLEPLTVSFGVTKAGEAYLFHGTKLDNILSIVENGFVLDRSKQGLYGTGIYLAESSQKADQYADKPGDRRCTFLPMFLVRASLGKVGEYDPKLHKNRKMEKGADSLVLEDTLVAGQNKRFREFVKNDPNQCYPEFLLIYDRVKEPYSEQPV